MDYPSELERKIQENRAHEWQKNGAKDAWESIKGKFTSSNSVPVERATITRKEINLGFRYWLSRLTDSNQWSTCEKEFDDWINDPFTHWISDTDAAWQAWQERQEEIEVLRARIKFLEGEEHI